MDLISAIANAKIGEIDEIKKLIENGSDINYVHNEKNSLCVACEHGRLDIVKILYKAGAKYPENEQNYDTPLAYASYYGYVNIVKYLIKKYLISDEYVKHSIYCAVHENNIDVLDYFLTLGYNLDFVPNNPLLAACNNKNIDAIDRLLNAGANVNVYSEKPLIYNMVTINNLDIIKRLVMFGGDINAKYKEYTPILLACINNCTEVAKFLIEMGCDINCCNNLNRTPLMYACKNNNIQLVKLLIKYKADINFLDKDGKKAIDYINDANNDEIKVFSILTNENSC